MNTESELLDHIPSRDIESGIEDRPIQHHAISKVFTIQLLHEIEGNEKIVQNIFHEQADIYPLSHSQRALWFLSKNAPDDAPYHVALRLRIESKVDTAILEGTFQEMAARHPALRTTFSIQNGEPLQMVHKTGDICFEKIDASGLTWNQLNNRMEMAYQRPFDLKKGPLIRMHLFSRSEEDHFLLITIHQLIFDHWSFLIFLDELKILYSAQKAGSCAFLPYPDKSYTDFVQWQAEMLSGSKGNRLRSYWQKRLSGELPVLDLTKASSPSKENSPQRATHSFQLDEDITKKVKALSQDMGKTIYMTLLAAFYVLLYRHSGQEDILVGFPTTERNRTEFYRTIGNFVNHVMLRENLSGDPTFRVFLGQVYRTVAEAMEHRDFPIHLSLDQIKDDYDTWRSPLHQVMFRIPQIGELMDLRAPGQKGLREKWDDLEINLCEIRKHEYEFNLILEMSESQGTLNGIFHYDPDLFDKALIAQMAKHFKTLLRGIPADPDKHLSELLSHIT